MDISIPDAAATAAMESVLEEAQSVGTRKVEDDSGEVERFRHQVDEFTAKADELEQRVNEVGQFYSSKKHMNNVKAVSLKDKDGEKQIASIKKPQDPVRREAASAKRMQELMRLFSTILRQITQHKWAWPFMEPVDVEGLGLHDYYEVIDKPMDFGTIKNQMEAKDGSGYKNVREICTDVRLVFKNAMIYNDEKSDVHVMAKTLLARFEEKWLQLLPKVIEEETRRKEEEAEASSDLQIAQETATAKLVRDISNEVLEFPELIVIYCHLLCTNTLMHVFQGGFNGASGAHSSQPHSKREMRNSP
ncbi:transcription factor GTE6 isoform X4 [Cinnamomum micranthum f. kanehirae]|uniref:Transcription factor GTE6 isoform X4 n=1 Tax=Cinnamomum micranthum f. kanehirae TaxID=337451 RepID=A0A3S3QHE6_9MAGN|nr:transcription factor GTE6 isoform X4 [Cinnamomum micranthum f. kanehirae]